MKREERVGDFASTVLEIIEAEKADLWTATPAEVLSFDRDSMTCVVQPTIKLKFTNSEGVVEWVALPKLTQVPVIFPSGGGYTLTFPVTAGDECLVVFSSRCIDSWWYYGGVREQSDLRMHHLSDGFAIMGARSLPRAIDDISLDAAELRSDDGFTRVKVKSGEITLIAPTRVIMETPELLVSGDIRDRYHTNLTGTLNSFRTKYNQHRHTGVQAGPSNTGTTTDPET